MPTTWTDMTMTMTASQAAVLAVASVTFLALLLQVNKHVDQPYMDEIFHAPQTQQYCAGRFHEWDPKITTFPGLYLVGAALSHVAALLSWNGQFFCSLPVLRSVNVLFSLGNVALLIRLRQQLAPRDPNGLLHAVMIAVFPVNFFFAFLYYTDCGALFFVLLMYSQAESVNLLVYPSNRGSFIFSALSGAAAVVFRQTNIIWVAFTAGVVIVRCLELSHGNYIYGYDRQNVCMIMTAVLKLFRRVLINFVMVVLRNLPSLLQLVWPFVVIVAAFVVFLIKNGGIVVGLYQRTTLILPDQADSYLHLQATNLHEASFHAAQLLYLTFVLATGFSVSLFAPTYVQKFAAAIRNKSKSIGGVVWLVMVVVGVFGVIQWFSPVHKFMLADNRHYTFYIWRKFFRKHALAKFLPSTLYMFFGWRCWIELRRNRSPLWALVYGIAVTLVLIPSPLVEPRYYLIPFVVFHLNTGKQSRLVLLATIFGSMLTNAATLYVFMYKPFVWGDGSIARFMW
ncbi:TPA: hypothetical protein N0F65_006641 [Lagenidium giganteum]|uniref:Dol-P-Glc:Glc(2)Man(9)GlcNAc(2)-PP-Dol alpha-1,2-glucosyltransferase n=1 Tax=Lagenidium giganteum TaxID=4803 RepID=A0AAV2Z976_9STRA|nr:TPA: hypothetical protein N0F65_006641 [Lagenidium giganteum]